MRIRQATALFFLTLSGAGAFTFSPYNGNWRSQTISIGKNQNYHAPRHNLARYLKKADAGGVEDVDQLALAVCELSDELGSAGERAVSAEEKVLSLQKQMEQAEMELKEKERILADGGAAWAKENASFLDRIAEMTNFAQKTDEEAADQIKTVREEAKQRQDELETEIAGLKVSLESAEEVLQEEREARAMMLSKLEKAEDTLEFEQMRIEKEITGLDKRIKEEASKVAQANTETGNLEDKIEEDALKENEIKDLLETERNQFQEDKARLNEKIQDGARVRELKKEQMSKRYDQIKENMTALWNSARNDAQIAEQKRKEAVGKKSEEIAVLQDELGEVNTEKEKIKKASWALRQTREDVLAEQRSIDERFKASLAERDVTIGQLRKDVYDLGENEMNLKQIINDMETKAQVDEKKLNEIKQDLERDMKLFQEKQKQLEAKLENSAKERRLKLQELDGEYHRIQKDMEEEMEEAKRDAMKKKSVTKKTYEDKIDDKNRKISGLKVDLGKATWESDHFQELVVQRRRSLNKSLTNVADLKKDIAERDRQITEYETNYRELLKLSVKITGQRLRKSRTRVRNLIGPGKVRKLLRRGKTDTNEKI